VAILNSDFLAPRASIVISEN
jgi:hypothetical protein